MGHELTSTDQMFSVRQKPWHELGVVLEDHPTIEQAIIAANLGWEVNLEDVFVNNNVVKGYKAALRSDNKDCLGIVSDKYKVLQNTKAFEFFQPFLDTEQAYLETAGSLKGGKRVWILAKLNSEDMIIDNKTNDRVEKYLLLSNSHDGSAAIRVGYTAVRVVCNNTLTCAEESVNSQLIRITHRGDIDNSLEMVRNTMSVVDRSFKTTEELYKKLAQNTNINAKDIKNYVQAIYSVESLNNLFYNETAITQEEVSAARKKLINRVEELFELEPAKNAWTMYNSFNYILNHERGRNLESSYNSLWFESAKRLNKKAFELALKY